MLLMVASPPPTLGMKGSLAVSRELQVTGGVTSSSVDAPAGETSRVTVGGRGDLCHLRTTSIASSPQHPIKRTAFELEGGDVPDRLF